ncbi:MAG: zinc ribbon domain-containing protein [Acidobacteriota bacterium]|nr:zinc ribbon domain-containing protein [Acidobacteriota bacterium]
MAIQRCPYCKAIIDEGEEYCSNCGTKLLFPEDESIEEEIPGEKIVDEEMSEDKTEPKKKKKTHRKKSVSEKEIEPEEEITELKEEDEELKEEIPLEPEEGEEFALDEAEPWLEGEDKEEEAKEDIEKEPSTKEIKETLFPDEEQKEEGPSQTESTDFETGDQEKMADSTEKEKEEIERFLKSLKKEREEKKKKMTEGEEIPPWASEIKESQPVTPPTPEEEKEEEPIEHLEEENEEEIPLEEEMPIEEETPLEEEPEQEIPTLETTYGLPEGIDQELLPFDEEPYKEIKVEKIRPPLKVLTWVKARIFDVIFIACLWLVTVWVASRFLEVSVFRLISVASWFVLAFYLVLLTAYFFLFFLFLGQTIGNYLFPRDKS